MALKVTEQRSVNIVGSNSPEWLISFFGSVFGNFLPIGVYAT
jgi:long-subunit acyl-CoA synthetase (AMP-forming)